MAVRSHGSYLAVIARNDRGKVLHIQTFKSIVSDPEVAELEAILKALQMAKNFEWCNVQLEANALTVIQALIHKDSSFLHWSADSIFQDIVLISTYFSNYSFC